MKTFQRITRASALALAIAAVPMLASASPFATAHESSPTNNAPCDCTMQMHHRTGHDAQAMKASDAKKSTSDAQKSASKSLAEREFEQQVWTAP